MTSSDGATLFQQEPGGATYRIPALLYIERSSIFLAFAEKRSSPRDQDALYLVMRRGVEVHGTLQWENAIAVRHAKLMDHRTMNPCPLYDAATATVFLFFICVRAERSETWQVLLGRNAARICYVTSTDHGRSWSSLVDVTEEVLGDALKNCATVAVGPGHGIQSACGRLTVPAYLYYTHARVCGLPVPWRTKPHSFLFYSDDHGKSWRRGGTLWEEQTGECEVAEVTRSGGPAVLYCSARTSSHFRAEATSSDQAAPFQSTHLCQELCEPPHGCQGSVVSYQPQEGHSGHDTSWLLYSHPTSNHQRVDLGIYLNKSPLVPGGWNQPWVINQGPSGYSDLAVCQGAHVVACLFECGAGACEKIVFRRFTVDELMDNLS